MELRRIRFAGFPTPLQRMPHLSRVLRGPELFIKRDDITDLAFGGNKARKLEFLFADAKNRGADVVIATGSVQSNCACMVAATARRLGMKPILILQGKEPGEYDGNLLLDVLLSADVRFVEAKGGKILGIMKALADELREKGFNPYIIPLGASTPLSVIGYANAVEELVNQFNEIGEKFDYIITACGTGGTQAGLILGTRMLNIEAKVLNITTSICNEKIVRE